MTPQKLKRINSSLSDQCFRCNQEIGTFFHSTWSCSKVQPFWINLRVFLEQIIGLQLPHNPRLLLLGDVEGIRPQLKLNKYQKEFIKISLAVAKKSIAVTWKSDSYLSMDRWNNEISNCIPLEKITYNLRNKYDTFLNIWRPYLQKIGLHV